MTTDIPAPLSVQEIQFANELADPLWSLSMPAVGKATITRLLEVIHNQNAALDAIALRVTDDDYDNASSALESIGDRVMSTGRVIVQREY
jgi:hypothetical protein